MLRRTSEWCREINRERRGSSVSFGKIPRNTKSAEGFGDIFKTLVTWQKLRRSSKNVRRINKSLEKLLSPIYQKLQRGLENIGGVSELRKRCLEIRTVSRNFLEQWVIRRTSKDLRTSEKKSENFNKALRKLQNAKNINPATYEICREVVRKTKETEKFRKLRRITGSNGEMQRALKRAESFERAQKSKENSQEFWESADYYETQKNVEKYDDIQRSSEKWR